MSARKSNQKNSNADKKQGPTSNQQSYSTSEAVIALKDELVNEAKANREQLGRPDQTHKRIEIATLIFVIITTIGVFIQAFVLHSSDVTFKDTLIAQKESSERQLRAYVGFAPGDVEDFGVPGKQRVRFIRKNHGSTPAYNVGQSSIGVSIIKIGEPINTGPGGCVKPNMQGLITMFPSTELPWILVLDTKAFTNEQIQLVKAGDMQFVYWGDVCYHDAFGKPHYTNYCWMYKGSSMTAKDAEACLGHNDSN